MSFDTTVDIHVVCIPTFSNMTAAIISVGIGKNFLNFLYFSSELIIEIRAVTSSLHELVSVLLQSIEHLSYFRGFIETQSCKNILSLKLYISNELSLAVMR